MGSMTNEAIERFETLFKAGFISKELVTLRNKLMRMGQIPEDVMTILTDEQAKTLLQDRYHL
jgi:hypothetical protein